MANRNAQRNNRNLAVSESQGQNWWGTSWTPSNLWRSARWPAPPLPPKKEEKKPMPYLATRIP